MNKGILMLMAVFGLALFSHSQAVTTNCPGSTFGGMTPPVMNKNDGKKDSDTKGGDKKGDDNKTGDKKGSGQVPDDDCD